MELVGHVEAGLGDANNLATFVPRAAQAILKYIRQTHGKAFVLFTSYKMLNEVARAIAQPLAELGIKMFQQGGMLGRRAMLEAFHAGQPYRGE